MEYMNLSRDSRIFRTFRGPVRYGLGDISRPAGDRDERAQRPRSGCWPRGEALIMTALGLAVAIHCGSCLQRLRTRQPEYSGRAQLFAHDVFTFLATGEEDSKNRLGRCGADLSASSPAWRPRL